MDKLQKTAKGIDTALKISYWANIAAAVFLGLMVMSLWRIYGAAPEISDVATVALDFGRIQFVIDPSISHHPHAYTNHVTAMSILPFCEVILWCMFIRSARKILTPMIAGQPFHQEMSAQLLRMGWLNIGMGLVKNIGQYFMFGNLIPGFDMDVLFLSESIVSYRVKTDWDLSFVLWSAALFLLSYIFKHGWELQQLSDETL